MPAQDSPAIIVARFLKANHYNDTLETFIGEAGLPPDAGTVEKGDLTIEKILEEKKVFDQSLRFEKTGLEDKEKEWSLPAPSFPSQIALPSSTNLLHVSIESLENDSGQLPNQVLCATTADRRLNFINIDQTFSVYKSMSNFQDSPILSCLPLATRDLMTISSGMSGQVVIYDHKTNRLIGERRDHKKYVVKIATCQEYNRTYVATAGWDGMVYLYQMTDPESGLDSPVAELTLPTNPETITFIEHPDAEGHVLLVTRRDSTSMYYYRLPEINPESAPKTLLSLELLGTQNLAPHSNAWVAFSPSSIAICPTDPTLLAVATSAVPHMKLIIVRLLLPPLTTPAQGSEPTTQAAQTRANLAVQDTEDIAIQIHVSTLAPQTPYSTPQVVWRPDGSGVWVNGDDGVLRGLEAKTGKIVTLLKDGHESGSKIRSIWCGMVAVEGREEEWIASGGFDRRLVVWRPKKTES